MPLPESPVFLGAKFQKSKHRAIAQSPVPGGEEEKPVWFCLQVWLAAGRGLELARPCQDRHTGPGGGRRWGLTMACRLASSQRGSEGLEREAGSRAKGSGLRAPLRGCAASGR